MLTAWIIIVGLFIAVAAAVAYRKRARKRELDELQKAMKAQIELRFGREQHSSMGRQGRELIACRSYFDRPYRAEIALPLIVTDRLANEALWSEVLNLGGYDVVAKPFE